MIRLMLAASFVPTSALWRLQAYPGLDQAPSQFEQSLALDLRKPIRGALMKALGAIAIVLVVLYFADQQFTQGQYSSAVQQMALQIRHSLGI